LVQQSSNITPRFDSGEVFDVTLAPWHSYVDLYHIAREFQVATEARLNGAIDWAQGPDYYWMSRQELHQALRTSGVFTPSRYNALALVMINWLQILDARNGILPALSPLNSSRYSTMSTADMVIQLQKMGCGQSLSNLRRPALLALCLENDPTGFQELSHAESTSIGRLLGHRLAISVTTNDDDVSRLGTQVQEQRGGLATTHTGTLVGPMPVLQQFQRWAIDLDFAPTVTSDVGFQCASRGLAMSLEAVLHTLQDAQPVADITSDDILSALFTDHDANVANDPSRVPIANARGQPTPEYAALLQERLEPLRAAGDASAYNSQYNEMLMSNNLSTDQITSALELLYQSGRLPRRMALGIVTGKSFSILCKLTWH